MIAGQKCGEKRIARRGSLYQRRRRLSAPGFLLQPQLPALRELWSVDVVVCDPPSQMSPAACHVSGLGQHEGGSSLLARLLSLLFLRSLRR